MSYSSRRRLTALIGTEDVMNMQKVATTSIEALQQKCIQLRRAIIEEVEVAGSGHYGSSLSLVEILTALYYDFLRVRPQESKWPQRDRLVLSKGHGVSALYPILADLGFFEHEHLATFTQLESILGDHPDVKKVPGIDFSSGSLGHGLSVGCGMAEAVRLQGFDSRIVVVVGDGEMDEGQVWEAAAYAGHRRLGNLMAVMDRNKIQVDGSTSEILDLEPLADKWRSFRWKVREVDGHDLAALIHEYNEFEKRRIDSEGNTQPTMVIANTVGGKGIPFIENDANWHIGYLDGPDRTSALEQIEMMYHPKRGES
jgi:transketolase